MSRIRLLIFLDYPTAPNAAALGLPPDG